MTTLDNADRAPARAIGAVTIATAIASVALLAMHPGGAAHNFADVLKQEADSQSLDALVHGGFIVVLAIQLVCYAVFSDRLGLRRATVVAGLVFFATGAAFLAASMLTDGLVIPAIAAKYAAAPAKIDFAKALLVLCTTVISFAMPMGLAFQAAGVLGWGWALQSGGASRPARMFGVALGALIIAAIAVTGMNHTVMMAAIATLAVWAAVCGALLATARV